MKINKVIGYCLSSSYGDGNVFGQPLGAKSIGLVEVHTDSGIIGIGETYAGVYVPELIEPTVRFIESLILGMNPLDIHKVYDCMNIPFVGAGGLIRSVVGAIEIALWDIKGQAEHKPIYELLNEDSINSFDVYASGGSVAFDVDDIKQDVEYILDEGFSAYKMRVGVKSWGEDLQRVETARNILGYNSLMVDAIMGTLDKWNASDAIHKINDLEKYNLTWIEEPIHPSNLNELRCVYTNINIPIATGEALSGKLEFDSYLNSGTVDIIQPDITHCGGYIEAMRVIKEAKDRDIKVALHVWGSSVSLLSAVHLARSCDVDWLEIPNVELSFMFEKYHELKNMVLHDSYILGDGLGIHIPEDTKNSYKFIEGSGYRL